MKIYTFFYACVPWLKKLQFPWVGPTENIYLAFNWLPTFPLLKKICQSEGGEERERERDIWNDPTSRCASAMIYCEQVVTHTSSNRWGGTRDGEGNKSAAHWGQTGGKVVKNREKGNKWKHWKESVWKRDSSGREGRGKSALQSLAAFQTVWTQELPFLCLIFTLLYFSHHGFHLCLPESEMERKAFHVCHFNVMIPLVGRTESKLARCLEFGTTHTGFDLLLCMSPAWEPTTRNFFFVGAAPELPWKSLSGSSTHILCQWKWGETGNIPCGTIGYHRPQRPLPVVHRHEWASKGLHNSRCRGTEINRTLALVS